MKQFTRSEVVVNFEAEVVWKLLLGHIVGLVGRDAPVLVQGVGELGLCVHLVGSLKRVVHGGSVGEDVLATSNELHWQVVEHLLVGHPVSHLIGVLEVLLLVVDEATSLGELVNVVIAKPVDVAFVVGSTHELEGLEFLLVLHLHADVVVFLNVGVHVELGAEVSHGPFFLLLIVLVLLGDGQL